MISDSNKQIIKTGKNSPYGRAVQELLSEALEEVSNIDNAHSEAELVGAQLAKKTLRKILSSLTGESIKVDKKKNQYL
jgi:hypothetical protein